VFLSLFFFLSLPQVSRFFFLLSPFLDDISCLRGSLVGKGCTSNAEPDCTSQLSKSWEPQLYFLPVDFSRFSEKDHLTSSLHTRISFVFFDTPHFCLILCGCNWRHLVVLDCSSSLCSERANMWFKRSHSASDSRCRN
jgi:hypothetical protein